MHSCTSSQAQYYDSEAVGMVRGIRLRQIQFNTAERRGYVRLLALARPLLATLLLATASLAVFPAPTHLLWMVAVAVTE